MLQNPYLNIDVCLFFCARGNKFKSFPEEAGSWLTLRKHFRFTFLVREGRETVCLYVCFKSGEKRIVLACYCVQTHSILVYTFGKLCWQTVLVCSHLTKLSLVHTSDKLFVTLLFTVSEAGQRSIDFIGFLKLSLRCLVCDFTY